MLKSNLMKKTVKMGVAILFAMACLQGRAEWTEFEADGVYYRIYDHNNKRVDVIAPPEGAAYNEACCDIPSVVTYNAEQYKVKGIDFRAFANCAGMKEIILNDDENYNNQPLYYIDDEAFMNSGLEHIVFPDSEVSVYVTSFMGCNNLDNIVFNSVTTTLYDYAFKPFPASVGKIVIKGDLYCEQPVALTSVAGVDGSDLHTLTDDNETVNLDMVIDWGTGHHYLSSLRWFTGRELTLSGGCKLLGPTYGNVETLKLEPAFDDYEPYLGSRVLYNCNNLGKIFCYDPIPWSVAADFITNDALFETVEVYVVATSIDDYKAHPVWGRFAKILPLENAVQTPQISEEDSPAEYYNLQGAKVTNPAPGTVVVRRSGSRVEKVKM